MEAGVNTGALVFVFRSFSAQPSSCGTDHSGDRSKTYWAPYVQTTFYSVMVTTAPCGITPAPLPAAIRLSKIRSARSVIWPLPNGGRISSESIVITQRAAICVVFAPRLSVQPGARPRPHWPNSENLRDRPSAQSEIDDSAAQGRGLPVSG